MIKFLRMTIQNASIQEGVQAFADDIFPAWDILQFVLLSIQILYIFYRIRESPYTIFSCSLIPQYTLYSLFCLLLKYCWEEILGKAYCNIIFFSTHYHKASQMVLYCMLMSVLNLETCSNSFDSFVLRAFANAPDFWDCSHEECLL